MAEHPATPSSAVATMPYAHAEDLAAVRAFVCSRALAGGLPARQQVMANPRLRLSR
ncbi:hypothetical protein ABZ807_16950 [Micromonospora sp. NPDC047548]|uniref:hypothetical protein n=1 Tax=Micromonospora sp. NPDC047548 TaxID=3155624 RepID=UPI0033D32044